MKHAYAILVLFAASFVAGTLPADEQASVELFVARLGDADVRHRTEAANELFVRARTARPEADRIRLALADALAHDPANPAASAMVAALCEFGLIEESLESVFAALAAQQIDDAKDHLPARTRSVFDVSGEAALALAFREFAARSPAHKVRLLAMLIEKLRTSPPAVKSRLVAVAGADWLYEPAVLDQLHASCSPRMLQNRDGGTILEEFRTVVFESLRISFPDRRPPQAFGEWQSRAQREPFVDLFTDLVPSKETKESKPASAPRLPLAEARMNSLMVEDAFIRVARITRSRQMLWGCLLDAAEASDRTSRLIEFRGLEDALADYALPHDLRRTAFTALGKQLEELANTPDAARRSETRLVLLRAMFALGIHPQADSPKIRGLALCLADADANVRYWAAFLCPGWCEPKECITKLVEMSNLGADQVAAALPRGFPFPPTLRCAGSIALGRFGEAAAGDVFKPTASFESPNTGFVHTHSFARWQVYRDLEAFKKLADAVGEKDGLARTLLAECLIKTDQIDAVAAWLKDPKPASDLRVAPAALLLARLPSPPEETVRRVLTSLMSETEKTLESADPLALQAIALLARHAPRTERANAIRILINWVMIADAPLSTTPPAIRMAMRRVLDRAFRENAPIVVREIVVQLAKATPAHRAILSMLLRSVPNEEHMAVILNSLNDKDEGVRIGALLAVAVTTRSNPGSGEVFFGAVLTRAQAKNDSPRVRVVARWVADILEVR